MCENIIYEPCPVYIALKQGLNGYFISFRQRTNQFFNCFIRLAFQDMKYSHRLYLLKRDNQVNISKSLGDFFNGGMLKVVFFSISHIV